MNIQMVPKVVKIKRERKYTKYRSPYKSYKSAEWIWSDIFLEIEELKITSTTFLKDVAEKYGIIYSTLRNKNNKYCNDKNIDTINTENRGGTNKTFLINDERELYNHIKTNFID